jgi:hypothetical protein
MLPCFDKVWENNDINNDVDVCLITGEPGPKDKGHNEILLSGQIYTSGFEIPFAEGIVKNDFLKSCFSSMKKKDTKPIDSEVVQEPMEHHLSKDNGTWRVYYITPYSRSKEKMVTVYLYSTLKPGGQINWEKELDHIYPFFYNMSRV